MRTTLLILFALLATLPLNAQKKEQFDNYLPKGFRYIQIGMAYGNFRKVMNMEKLQLTEKENQREYVEERGKRKIKTVTYVFSWGESKRLEEVVIDFEKSFDLEAFMQERYGAANDGDEWLFEEEDSISTKVWREGNQLHVSDAGF